MVFVRSKRDLAPRGTAETRSTVVVGATLGPTPREDAGTKAQRGNAQATRSRAVHAAAAGKNRVWQRRVEPRPITMPGGVCRYEGEEGCVRELVGWRWQE